MKRLVIAKVIGAGLIFWLLDRHPDDRRDLLWVINGLQGGVDIWNEYAIRKYGVPESGGAGDHYHNDPWFAPVNAPPPLPIIAIGGDSWGAARGR